MHELIDETLEEIRGCADAFHPRFDDATVRSRILTLATRETRRCLRQEHCEALAAQP